MKGKRFLARPDVGLSTSMRSAADAVKITNALLPRCIFWGFLAHTGLYVMAGRGKEVHPVMYALGAISAGLLLLEHGKW